MKRLKVVEVLQYNGVNMKVISTKRTTVKMGLLHWNTPVDFHFWVYELLMSLKTWASGEGPWASKIWELLAQRARWNSNIFRALNANLFLYATHMPTLVKMFAKLEQLLLKHPTLLCPFSLASQNSDPFLTGQRLRNIRKRFTSVTCAFNLARTIENKVSFLN